MKAMEGVISRVITSKSLIFCQIMDDLVICNRGREFALGRPRSCKAPKLSCEAVSSSSMRAKLINLCCRPH